MYNINDVRQHAQQNNPLYESATAGSRSLVEQLQNRVQNVLAEKALREAEEAEEERRIEEEAAKASSTAREPNYLTPEWKSPGTGFGTGNFAGGAIQQAKTDKMLDENLITEEQAAGQKPVEAQGPKTKKEIKTNAERDALIKEYARIQNSNAIPAVRRREEIQTRLNEIDQELGNGEMDHTFSDRVASTVSGAAKQIGSGVTSFVGTLAKNAGETMANGTTNNLIWRQGQGGNPDSINAKMAPAVDKFGSTVEEAAKKIDDSAVADINRAKTGLSKFGQAGVDIATNVIQMGFDAGVGALTGGGSLASMFVRSAGGAMQKARDEGANTTQQTGFGLTSGLIEVVTEKLADGVAKIYGGGAADDVAEKLVRRFAKTDLGRTVLRGLYGMVSEGGEEVLSDLLAPYAELIYNDKSFSDTIKNTFKGTYDPSELMYDFLIGFAVGGLGQGASIVTGQSAQANAELKATDAIQNRLIANGMDEAQARRAANILADVAKGKPISGRNSAFLESVQASNFNRATEQTEAQANAQAPVQPVNGRNYEDVGNKAQNPEKADAKASETATPEGQKTLQQLGQLMFFEEYDGPKAVQDRVQAMTTEQLEDVSKAIPEDEIDRRSLEIVQDELARRQAKPEAEAAEEPAPAEQPAETPAETPAEQPSEQPTEAPAEDSAPAPEAPQESAEAPSGELNSEPEEEDTRDFSSLSAEDVLGMFTTYFYTKKNAEVERALPKVSDEQLEAISEMTPENSYQEEAIDRVKDELIKRQGGVTSAMEAAERAANAGEAPPKGVDKLLQDAQEKHEAALEKAAEQKTEEPEPQKKPRIKPLSENEKILAADKTRLERENKSLRKQVKNLEKQTKKTDVKTARESDVRKVANQLIKDRRSEADRSVVAKKLQALADYIVSHTGEEIDYAEIESMAQDIADDIVQGIGEEVNGAAADAAKVIRRLGRSNTVNFSELAAEFAMEDAKAEYPFLKKLSRTEGDSVQDFYKTLLEQEELEGLLPENISGSRQQLDAIKEILRAGEMQVVHLYDPGTANYDQAMYEMTNEVIDAVLSDAIRESEPTFADKADAKLNATKSKMQQKIDAEKAARQADRQASRERMDELRREASQKKREAIAKERAEKYASNKKIREHYQQILERKENRRKTSAQRKKIKALWDDLSKRVSKPVEDKYVPKDLMKYTVELLESIDTDTGSERSAEKLNKLYAEFNKIKNDSDFNIAFDDVHEAAMADLVEVIGGTPLSDMNADQLDRVYNALKTITHEIKDGVKVKIRNEEHQASEIAKQMTEEVQQAKGFGKEGIGRAIRSWYVGSFTRGTTFFERLGGFKKNSAWSQMGEHLNNGQLKATEEKVRAARKFNDLLTDKQSASLRSEVSLGKDAEGNDIKISRGMMISLKMLLNSEDGMRHIKYGGLTIPGINDYYKGKNDNGYGTTVGRALGISPELSKAQEEYRNIYKEYEELNAAEDKTTQEWEDKIDDVVTRMDAKQAEIDSIYEKGEDYIKSLNDTIDKNLTDYDQRWIDRSKEYFKEAQELLNETTMEVYGLKKANVDDYFPLVTDPNFRKANFESISRDMSLENAGFMKARVKASNPILLMDISEVIAHYSDKVASYTGLMPAIRDFQKVYGKTEPGFNNSLKAELNQKFGMGANQYIEDLMADLQGARSGSSNPLGKVLSNVRGNMAQAVLSLNPRVAWSQSASYLNAASEIGYAPLVKGISMGKNPAKNAAAMDLVTKYSPLMYYRTLGNANAAMTDIRADAKWQNQMLKKFDFVMGWINAVDQKTVGRLWYASEAYVQQQGTDYEKGSDEYYQEVAKVFNKVVEKTQPNYTAMQRAGILRDPNELIKSMTMFMTQRLQNQNILYEAKGRLDRYSEDFKNGANGVTEADLKKARKDMANAVTSQVLSTASLVVMKAAVDALMHNTKGYRDDEKKLTPESISAKVLGMFADSMIGNFLGGSELYGLYNGFFKKAYYDGITINGISSLSNALKDATTAANAKPEKQLAAWAKVGEDVAKLFGIPLENGEKIVNAIRKHAIDIANGDLGTFESDLTVDNPTVDFGDTPDPNFFTPVRNYLMDKGLLEDDDKAIKDEINRLYEATNQRGVYPSIRTAKSFTVDGVDYDLEGEELEKYHQTAGQNARKLATEIINSESYKGLTDEQKVTALRTAYSYAKDMAKDEYVKDHKIETESRSTVDSLLSGLDKPGTSNDKTKLDRNNLASYIIYNTAFKSNIDAGNFGAIDKQVTAYYRMNTNMKTVLYERNSDLKKLVGYHNIGMGSRDYFKMKESVTAEQIRLDEDANTSSYLRLYAIANASLPETSRKKLVQDLVLGDSNFIGSNGKAAYDALSKQGMTVAQTAKFFDIALHCKSWKDTGDEADQNGTLKPDTVTYALLQTPGLTDSQRKTIYNDIRSSVSNYYNDWGTYTWESEVKYVNKSTNKATYSVPATAMQGTSGSPGNPFHVGQNNNQQQSNQQNYILQALGIAG